MEVKINLQFNILYCFQCIQGGWALDESMLVPWDDDDENEQDYDDDYDHNYGDDYEEDDDHLQK